MKIEINGIEYSTAEIIAAYRSSVEVMSHAEIEDLDDREMDAIYARIRDLSADSTDLPPESEWTARDVVFSHELTDTGMDICVDVDQTEKNAKMRREYEAETEKK